MEDLLMNIGLTHLQAKTYLRLLELGSAAPPQISKDLKISRTNAYKVLDRLVEIGLSSKSEVEKKLVYSPEDPVALTSFVAEERNKVIALEHQTKEALLDLRKKFQKASGNTDVRFNKGKNAMIAAYEQQADSRQPIYFIKSRADTPFMGFEAMNRVRMLTRTTGVNRYGITQDTPDAPINNSVDKASNLNRTWMPAEDYTAPVEWSVAGDNLNILVFDEQTYVVRIKDAVIADAFRQIWRLLDKNLKSNPGYASLPRKAKRAV